MMYEITHLDRFIALFPNWFRDIRPISGREFIIEKLGRTYTFINMSLIGCALMAMLLYYGLTPVTVTSYEYRPTIERMQTLESVNAVCICTNTTIHGSQFINIEFNISDICTKWWNVINCYDWANSISYVYSSNTQYYQGLLNKCLRTQNRCFSSITIYNNLADSIINQTYTSYTLLYNNIITEDINLKVYNLLDITKNIVTLYYNESIIWNSLTNERILNGIRNVTYWQGDINQFLINNYILDGITLNYNNITCDCTQNWQCIEPIIVMTPFDDYSSYNSTIINSIWLYLKLFDLKTIGVNGCDTKMIEGVEPIGSYRLKLTNNSNFISNINSINSFVNDSIIKTIVIYLLQYEMAYSNSKYSLYNQALENLFLETSNIIINYPEYVKSCGINYCSYQTFQPPTPFNLFITVISLIGGGTTLLYSICLFFYELSRRHILGFPFFNSGADMFLAIKRDNDYNTTRSTIRQKVFQTKQGSSLTNDRLLLNNIIDEPGQSNTS